MNNDVMEQDRGRRGRLAWTVVLTILVAGLAWLVGVTWLKALLLATAVATTGVVLIALRRLDDEAELPLVEGPSRNDGIRREVSRLSWALAGQDNLVGEMAFRRLRKLARDRLSQLGIDLDVAEGQRAAREALGSLGYDTLIAEVGRPPTQKIFQQCVGVLESLDDRLSAPAQRLGLAHLTGMATPRGPKP
jgi:hypothetical protein